MNIKIKEQEVCPLCSSFGNLFFRGRKQMYYNCSSCLGIFVGIDFLPGKDDEYSRYKKHCNDVNDIGYREFVSPLAKKILGDFNEKHFGLDYGAGPGPVISKLLFQEGLNVKQYDPFFYDQPGLLNEKYDYIICSEVIEHFHNPFKEFKLLRDILNPGGKLYCMTELYMDNIDFGSWYYKNDFTHVFFYRHDTFNWIRNHFKFKDFSIEGRIIILE